MAMRTTVAALVVASGLAGTAGVMPAASQATRTWVSGVGDDVNPCSRTAPCKTFAGAISKTAANGEINCLDSGGFGAVTIMKSIAIQCEGVIGGVMATGTNGIVINAGDTDRVLLSGLDINGGGTGINGLLVLKAGSVVLRSLTVYGFRTPASAGVTVKAGQVSLADSIVVHNTTGISGPVTSGGGNMLSGNGTDGKFAGVIAPR